MPITPRFRTRQGELFSPPEQLPTEAHQRMVRLLARMMNGHLQKGHRRNLQAEVGDK